jgi:acetyl-CoA decarbonylase/synthase, CODH/ACS complex subunit delta
MDVNLAKQLNILITDMGLPADRIIMDPTVGALGYGIEYGYSVMERLRMAALQGDSMTQFPMLVTVGYEAWKTKKPKSARASPKPGATGSSAPSTGNLPPPPRWSIPGQTSLSCGIQSRSNGSKPPFQNS